MRNNPRLFALACVLACAPAMVRAASFATDFNSGLPAGSSVYGNTIVSINDGGGGVTNSGCLQLTRAVTSQNGAFVITNDLDSGTPVTSFTASFKVLIGGSSARWEFGNGLSFNFAPDVPLGTVAFPEMGVGSGLTIGFETVKDNAANPAPAILAQASYVPVSASPVFVDGLRANKFVDAVIQLNPDNTLDVIYDGVYVYSNAPTAFGPTAGSLFWIGSRTGSWVDNHFIDNLKITTSTTPAPFVNSFGPQGRQVSSSAGLQALLTDYGYQVNSASIGLTLDGVTVTPTVTQDGNGNTAIHFAPATPFAPASTHQVTLTFTDTAPQTQTLSWEFTVAEALPTDLVTIFSDDFESYNLGYLDKNLTGDPNYAPNGSGNPWFGPWPENYSVLESDTLVVEGTNCVVIPHSGSKMLTTSWADTYSVTIWVDLAYRWHNGQPIRGNCMLDWWCFDANDQANGFKDYISLYYYNSAAAYPYTADWRTGWDPSGGLFWANGFGWGINDFQSLSLGGSDYSQTGGNYDASKYQIRLEEMAGGGSYGIDGWINTIPRTQGWHHNRILLGPPHGDGTVMVYFYIDDMATPVYSGLSSIAAQGINLLEIDTGQTTTRAFYDDISFALVRPPDLLCQIVGDNLVLNWAGEGFTLQSAPTVNGPWTDIAAATSPYSYSTTAPVQFFRLRN